MASRIISAEVKGFSMPASMMNFVFDTNCMCAYVLSA